MTWATRNGRLTQKYGKSYSRMTVVQRVESYWFTLEQEITGLQEKCLLGGRIMDFRLQIE